MNKNQELYFLLCQQDSCDVISCQKGGKERAWSALVFGSKDGRETKPKDTIRKHLAILHLFKRIWKYVFLASIKYHDGFQDLCTCLVRNSETLVWLFSVCVERKTFLHGRMEREAQHASEMCSWSEKKGGWWSRQNGLVLSQYSPQPVSKSDGVIYLKRQATRFKFHTALNILFYLVDLNSLCFDHKVSSLL